MNLFDRDGNPVTRQQLIEALDLTPPEDEGTEQITVHVQNRDGVVISAHTFDTPRGGRRLEVLWPEGTLTYARRDQ